MKASVKQLLKILLLLALFDCQSTLKNTVESSKPENHEVSVDESTIDFTLYNKKRVKLKANIYQPKKTDVKAAMLFITGSGNNSRLGEKVGDGIENYATPINSLHERSMIWAHKGFMVMSYDKRTCKTQMHSECLDNPTDDIDEKGPTAFITDVNAAINFAKKQTSNKPLIVIAEDQAAQIVLKSSARTKADLIVLISPIPARIDEVMIEGYAEAANNNELDSRLRLQLIRRSKSLAETFTSLKRGLFPTNSNILGISAKYWLSWIKMTEKPFEGLSGLNIPVLMVVGGKDRLYANKHQKKIMQEYKMPNKYYLKLWELDHNLLKNGAISPDDENKLLEKIIYILKLA